MDKNSLVLGIDLGTSGIRIAILDYKERLIYSSSAKYLLNFEDCEHWKRNCQELIKNIPKELRERLIACCVDGTSGTLLACKKNGTPIGKAIPYYITNKESKKSLLNNFPTHEKSLNLNTSIIRAKYLIDLYGENILFRHQADWITGWLLNCWKYGEEGNNIRLGWDLLTKSWIPLIQKMSWDSALPKIIPSGNTFGLISKAIAYELGLPEDLQIIAGTTDSNAAVVAVNANKNEGITVLGSTIVIKKFVPNPIQSQGITNHLIGGKWIAGGASNGGGAVLKQFFSDKALKELSRQINPENNSGIKLIPLAFKGERFPTNDPNLEPVLEPRPTSDSLYLHALLEGLAQIEAKGWEKLASLGVCKPKKIITIGGGARNAQWRRIRERLIGIPIRSSTKEPAEGVARIAIQAIEKKAQ